MSEFDEFIAGITRSGAGLAVDADLRLVVTTATGDSTIARVTGSGQQVSVEAQRPDVLLAAVDRADVGRVADLLTAAGITVEVHGPRGPVVTLGAGTSNRVGRALTGSGGVAPTSQGAVRLVWASRRVRVTVGALRTAIAAVAIGRLRRAAGDRPD